ncbi:DUF262 domain-containing protein [Helicobacter saguini]|uniref:DUF262 domain-containing protein n=1 Tax=Helicobacter saguini TaxID=1548018 RepID=A0A347VQ56_9HELI|nr:DUF262 domain-containing protein [Helicobacter saguini]MWV61069.1 DUF262 domain-containing protein [Helicobacter saguini]MWV68262.1 DUF262 domain-containing protein [Helicobacter saguini]MWV70274.1 DUF262 domain-containing protein [Helicobacter saguini]MWV72176.1 DUF262 domain-containing protein [Helicobacter saguini]TLD95235.1 DUF262 domain-containing protein [Helicobacter saguini]
MEARENNFNFVRDEKRLIIPFFQRAYVWKQEHWEQFLDDLYSSFQEKREHFLGSIILKRQQGVNNESLVIDGQQRLTTFSILLKVLFNKVDDDKKKHFNDYLFESFTNDKPKINHSRLDKEQYCKVLQNVPINQKEENGIYGCFNYFNKQIEELKIDSNEIFEFMKFIIESKLWVIVCLKDNEDEQKIFDSINSTGERLSATDIIKNAIFDKAIKESNEEKALEYYKTYWENIFEKDEKERNFWNKEIETGRIKRTRSEILLHAVAIIKGIFDADKDNLSKLSVLYKQDIQKTNIQSLHKMLEQIAQYAQIYRNFPQITKETDLSFENYEERFFHLIDVFNINAVLPLVICLKHKLDSKIYKECLYLLEMLILCNDATKDYNKFFAKIIKEDSKDIVEFMKQEIKEKYENCLKIDSIKQWLKNIENKDAKFILFWIELYREYKDKDFRDRATLHYEYTLEHLLPQKWESSWSDVIKDKEKASDLIYQIGNMTLVKGALNAALRNSNWQTKLNGTKKTRHYLKKNAELLITKELFGIEQWSEDSITKRTNELIKDFLTIWNVEIF